MSSDKEKLSSKTNDKELNDLLDSKLHFFLLFTLKDWFLLYEQGNYVMYEQGIVICFNKILCFQGVLEDFDKSKDATVTVPTAVPGDELLPNDEMMQ